MASKRNQSSGACELRRKADEIVQDNSDERTLHELRVHQIELERQNEELRRTQKELETALERYFDRYELAPFGDITLSDTGVILEANLTAATLLGVARGAVAGQQITQFIIEEDHDIFYLHRKRFFETGAQQACELRMLKQDKTAFWAHLKTTTARDAGGASTCRVVISDVSESKRDKEELLMARDHLGKILNTIPDPIFVKDTKHAWILLNDAFCRFVGHDREELIGKSDYDFFPRHEADMFWEKDETVFRTKQLVSNEETITDAKGVPHVISTRKVLCSDVHGENFLVASIRDITERKKTEREALQLTSQLQQAAKMEAVGRLAGGVAHDFNNMISIILSYAQFAIENLREGDQLMSDLVEIKRAGERAAALTEQLLAFSRKKLLSPVALDLNRVTKGIENMLRRVLGKDIEFVLKLEPELGITLADQGQIEQVLVNLVANARDAMPCGGRLTLETANTNVEPENCVRLTITDTGCGIDEQTMSKLFEPFVTTKEKGRGTGLGLPSAYGIIKQSGGNITVSSKPGLGTTVNICLPRELSAATMLASLPAKAEVRVIGTETILLVEDELALLKVAKRTLEGAGYEVLAAANANEALLKCARHQSDIHMLLTDVIMAGMSGRELASEVLKIRPGLKILYMSGCTEDMITRQGVLGMETHFLGKPFTLAGLTNKVGEVLHGVTRIGKQGSGE